jgi:hypothetical protein
MDIFQNTILCANCNIKMNRIQAQKNGFVLRSVICPKCSLRIIHPKDEQEYKEFMELKHKQFQVKMRFVGNSYAVSIPREIVDFMQDQQKAMDEMVKLSFEEFGRITLKFGDNDSNEIRKEKELREKLKKENKYH